MSLNYKLTRPSQRQDLILRIRIILADNRATDKMRNSANVPELNNLDVDSLQKLNNTLYNQLLLEKD